MRKKVINRFIKGKVLQIKTRTFPFTSKCRYLKNYFSLHLKDITYINRP